MSVTTTDSELLISDRIVFQHSQLHQYRPKQPSQPPFEISAKAKRILGLGYDGFHINVPALRLTAATPESWADLDEQKRRERIRRFEIHLAQQTKRPKFVEQSFEFPSRRVESRTSSRQGQGRASSRQAERRTPSRQERTSSSLDLPRQKPSPKIEQRPTQSASDAVSPSKDRASLDLPQKQASPKTEQRPPRPRYYSQYSPHGRASLDASRPDVSAKSEERPTRPVISTANVRQGRASLDSPRTQISPNIGQRPVSFQAYKPKPGPGPGSSVIAQQAAARRGKSSSFPNFSRPLSHAEARKSPGEDVGGGRLSVERSRVQSGEIVRPKMIGGETEQSKVDAPLAKEITVSPDEGIEEDTPLPPQIQIQHVDEPTGTTLPPRVEVAEANVATIPRTSSAARSFNNTSMNVFPSDKGCSKRKTRPRLAKLLTSLPLCLVRTENRRVTKSKGHSARLRNRSAYNRYLLTEENLRQLEEDVGSVPKLYALDVVLLPSPPIRTHEGTRDRFFLPPPLPAQGPVTPPISQQSSKTPTPANSAQTMKELPALPTETPPATPILEQSTAAPRLPERVVLSRGRQTCEVCKESRHVAHFSTWAPTTRCKHPSQTCVACMQKWIETCIDTKGWDQCVCPQCSEPLAYDDVKLFATQEVFARYDHLSTRATLSSVPNFHWCQSPTCTSGQINGDPTSTNFTFTCTSCGHAHCLNHPYGPYHTGETCAEYDLRTTPITPSAPSSQQLPEERANEQYVQETSKRCPNAMCGWFIEKNEGCDRMTCWKCRFEFCWECRAPFGPIERKGNKFHREGCKYWG